jgi:hypothetical protein
MTVELYYGISVCTDIDGIMPTIRLAVVSLY